jgi:hypothetical protein
MLKQLKNRSMKQKAVNLLFAVTLATIWTAGITPAQSRVSTPTISKPASNLNYICPPWGCPPPHCGTIYNPCPM